MSGSDPKLPQPSAAPDPTIPPEVAGDAAYEILTGALTDITPDTPAEEVAQAYLAVGIAVAGLRRLDKARSCLEQALAIYRGQADATGEGRTLMALGKLRLEAHQYQLAKDHLVEAVARLEDADLEDRAHALTALGTVQSLLGERLSAHRSLSEALQLFVEAGDVEGELSCLRELGPLSWEMGDTETAERYFARESSIAQRLMPPEGPAETRDEHVTGDTPIPGEVELAWQPASQVLTIAFADAQDTDTIELIDDVTVSFDASVPGRLVSVLSARAARTLTPQVFSILASYIGDSAAAAAQELVGTAPARERLRGGEPPIGEVHLGDLVRRRLVVEREELDALAASWILAHDQVRLRLGLPRATSSFSEVAGRDAPRAPHRFVALAQLTTTPPCPTQAPPARVVRLMIPEKLAATGGIHQCCLAKVGVDSLVVETWCNPGTPLRISTWVVYPENAAAAPEPTPFEPVAGRRDRAVATIPLARFITRGELDRMALAFDEHAPAYAGDAPDD